MARTDFGIRRVALVSDWFLPRVGGIETHLADLATALAENGVSPEVLTTTPGKDGPVQPLYPIRRIPARRAPHFGFPISLDLTERVTTALRAGHFDLVHAHASVISPLAVAGLVAARRLNLPAVLTFHSMLLRSADVLRWSDRVLGWSRAPVLYTAVSGLVAAQARRAVGEAKVRTLTNGVNLGAWPESPRRPFDSGKPIVIATAMRLMTKKRPIPLVTAFLKARGSVLPRGRDLELHIAGDGPLRGRIEAIVSRLPGGGQIKLLGAQSRDQLRDLYARSDVFVMPSTRESFGIAALEARASGLPVIAMAGTGMSEFLDHEKTGLLARNDDDLSGLIVRMALDDGLRARLAPRDPGLHRFDWRGVVDQHIDAYASAAALMQRWTAPGVSTVD